MELHNWNEKEATHGYGLGSTCNNIKTYFGEKKKKKIMEKKSVKKQISGLLWTSSRNMEIMCTV